MKKPKGISRIKRNKKINVFLLFLVLSIIFLVLTKLSKDYTQTLTFQVNTTQVPENQVILKDSTHQLDITLTTYGFKFLRYFIRKPSIDISTNDLEKYDKNYLWTKGNGFSRVVSQFDTDVKIDAVEPDSLWFRYDENGVKKVPVLLKSNITFLSGYNVLDSISHQPDSIKIIGPQVILDSIDAVLTNELVMEDIDNNIDRLIDLDLPVTEEKLDFSHTQVKVAAQVERFTEGTVSVPVILRNVPEGMSVNFYPKEVNVIYYTSLSNFKNITANSFVVACDFTYAREGNSYLTPQIVQIPEGIKGVRLSTDKIEYIITQ